MRQVFVGGDSSMDFDGTMNSLKLKKLEDLDSFFFGGQKLLTRCQEAIETDSETMLKPLELNFLPMRYGSFCYRAKPQPVKTFQSLEERAADYSWDHTQRHKWQSGSVETAVKKDFKMRPKKGYYFGIPEHIDKSRRT